MPPEYFTAGCATSLQNSLQTALRLGRYFKMSAQFWLNLPTQHDLEVEQERLGKRLEKEVKVRPAA